MPEATVETWTPLYEAIEATRGDLSGAQLQERFANLIRVERETSYGFGFNPVEEVRSTILRWLSPVGGEDNDRSTEPDPFGLRVGIQKRYKQAMAATIIGNMVLSRALIARSNDAAIERLSEEKQAVLKRARAMNFTPDGLEERLLELFFFAGGYEEPNLMAKYATNSKGSFNATICKLKDRRPNPLKKFMFTPMCAYNGHNYPTSIPALTRASNPMQECLYLHGSGDYRAGNSLGLPGDNLGFIHISTPAEIVAWFLKAENFATSANGYINANVSLWTPPENRWKSLMSAWNKLCQLQGEHMEGSSASEDAGF